MKENILFVGLDYEFVKRVALELSKILDMFFLDVNDLIEYSLIDAKNIETVCGVEYFEKEKKKIVLSVNQYENTIINFPYTTYLERGVAAKLKDNNLSIFIDVDENVLQKRNTDNELNIELIAKEQLTNLIKKRVDIVVSCSISNVQDCIGRVIDVLKSKFYN